MGLVFIELRERTILLKSPGTPATIAIHDPRGKNVLRAVAQYPSTSVRRQTLACLTTQGMLLDIARTYHHLYAYELDAGTQHVPVAMMLAPPALALSGRCFFERSSPLFREKVRQALAVYNTNKTNPNPQPRANQTRSTMYWSSNGPFCLQHSRVCQL